MSNEKRARDAHLTRIATRPHEFLTNVRRECQFMGERRFVTGQTLYGGDAADVDEYELADTIQRLALPPTTAPSLSVLDDALYEDPYAESAYTRNYTTPAEIEQLRRDLHSDAFQTAVQAARRPAPSINTGVSGAAVHNDDGASAIIKDECMHESWPHYKAMRKVGPVYRGALARRSHTVRALLARFDASQSAAYVCTMAQLHRSVLEVTGCMGNNNVAAHLDEALRDTISVRVFGNEAKHEYDVAYRFECSVVPCNAHDNVQIVTGTFVVRCQDVDDDAGTAAEEHGSVSARALHDASVLSRLVRVLNVHFVNVGVEATT